MLFELRPEEYPRVWPLVQELAEYNLYVKTVCEGITPGKVLVDDALNPRSAFMDTPEGSFLVGDPGNTEFNASLKEKLPYLIDLSIHPDTWDPIVWEIINNKALRRHTYRHYTFNETRVKDSKNSLPPGYELRRVDAETLGSTLENLDEVTHGIEKNWHSTQEFLDNGFCFIITHGDTVASRCGSDCVSGHRCEIGIWTAPDHRRKGLATHLARRTVEHCLTHGITDIGWHCIDTNRGSIKVAEHTGFHRTRDYPSYGTELPAANPTDLTPETWHRLAEEYEATPDNLTRYRAAECWALADQPTRSITTLNTLIDNGWLTPKLTYLLQSWPFEALQSEEGWTDLQHRLKK